jgi:hypothetical protein
MLVATDGMPDNPPAALAAAKVAKLNRVEIITVSTNGADETFLAQLRSQRQLSVTVPATELERGISEAGRFLPRR